MAGLTTNWIIMYVVSVSLLMSPWEDSNTILT
jgi:hypothetical protein